MEFTTEKMNIFISRKKALDKYVENIKNTTVAGEEREWSYGRCNRIYCHNDDVSFKIEFFDPIKTWDDGIVYSGKVFINCVNTNILDIEDNKIYYDTIGKVPFVVIKVSSDGWSGNIIRIRNPFVITPELLREYEEWKTSCKKYNEKIFSNLNTTIRIENKKFNLFKFKRENRLTTEDIRLMTEILRNVYISRNKLNQFNTGDFSWMRFDEIFDTEDIFLSCLPVTVKIIEASLLLLEKKELKDNRTIIKSFKNKK